MIFGETFSVENQDWEGYLCILQQTIQCRWRKRNSRNHLRDLGEEFQHYFEAELHTKREIMCMTRNSYCCDVNDIPIALQEESLEVQNKSSAKDIFKESELHEFWMQMTRIYSKTSEFALRYLLIFCSIFHQNKTRNKLSVEVDLH